MKLLLLLLVELHLLEVLLMLLMRVLLGNTARVLLALWRGVLRDVEHKVLDDKRGLNEELVANRVPSQLVLLG